MTQTRRAAGFLHGGDYNPEQWLEDPQILETDLAYFKKAHINEVTLGVFSWAALEPREGEYDFAWMRQIIDRLYENRIHVILATPTGARPKWMADKYPQVLRVADNGQRDFFGTRHNHCNTSPIYREKVREIDRRLSQAFGNHPAVIAWHISNEFGGCAHDCFCPLCQEKFRDYLRKKYGSIKNLNRAWATTFWSHTYQAFDQIEAPSSIGEMSLHGLNLDWRRFVTESTADFIRAETEAIREGGSDLPTTINLMYDFKPLNYHSLAQTVDFISWDNYPAWHKKEEALTAADAGMQHDIMRSLKKAPFLLMESCPSATNWQPVSKLKKPGMLLASSLQAVAHGADSVLYFQLRQSRGASEKFHGAVIDHYGGDDTRVFAEVTQVGKALQAMGETAGSEVVSQAAVLFDWESRWAMEDAAGPRNSGLFYKETVQKSWQAFRRMGLNVDVIDMTQPLEGYKVVAMPMLYMFREDYAQKIRSFVEQGGRVIMTYWSGIVDETDLCFLGGTPHDLMDVMGLRSAEIDGLYDWERNAGVPVPGNELGIARSYECRNLCDLVRLCGAEALMTYESDFYKGMPALTVNQHGKGKAYYVCADFEQAFYDDVYEEIAKEAGLAGVMEQIPEGVAVSTRQTRDARFLFVQNFRRDEVSLSLPEGTVLFGNASGALAPLESVVIKLPV